MRVLKILFRIYTMTATLKLMTIAHGLLDPNPVHQRLILACGLMLSLLLGAGSSNSPPYDPDPESPWYPMTTPVTDTPKH